MKQRPSIERLREVFDYDKGTGLLHWRVTNSNVAVAGSIAGSYDGRYVRVMVDGCKMLAHRVIWAWVTGEWPALDVDHEDTDGSNNRWNNLRPATTSQNIANSKISKANTTGFKGVVKHRKRFRAQIMHNGKNKYLGLRSTAEAAHELYLAEAIRLQGEFARAV